MRSRQLTMYLLRAIERILRMLADYLFRVTSPETESVDGPPADWVERVRRAGPIGPMLSYTSSPPAGSSRPGRFKRPRIEPNPAATNETEIMEIADADEEPAKFIERTTTDVHVPKWLRPLQPRSVRTQPRPVRTQPRHLQSRARVAEAEAPINSELTEPTIDRDETFPEPPSRPERLRFSEWFMSRVRDVMHSDARRKTERKPAHSWAGNNKSAAAPEFAVERRRFPASDPADVAYFNSSVAPHEFHWEEPAAESGASSVRYSNQPADSRRDFEFNKSSRERTPSSEQAFQTQPARFHREPVQWPEPAESPWPELPEDLSTADDDEVRVVRSLEHLIQLDREQGGNTWNARLF